ncbi:hypothetical protein [Leptolyngbya sp. 7M]|uniref:hypothetical protein n=1 Tax=Leptolyngbya sp. 7M TaxID=2812896 RepID=UPI001B8CDF43|nr:hypothetical protein [Leptolyngbya sp. 7M]QYO62444.1 hypothetical protein JVX88_20450 [Leptolyngbya sp. 7M]
MIKGINTLSWVAILCGILGFDGSQIATAANGMLRDSAQDKFALLNDHQQLALQPTRPTETPDQWVELGRRVHGGFGSYIALGIRIGLDAMQRALIIVLPQARNFRKPVSRTTCQKPHTTIGSVTTTENSSTGSVPRECGNTLKELTPKL